MLLLPFDGMPALLNLVLLHPATCGVWKLAETSAHYILPFPGWSRGRSWLNDSQGRNCGQQDHLHVQSPLLEDQGGVEPLAGGLKGRCFPGIAIRSWSVRGRGAPELVDTGGVEPPSGGYQPPALSR